MHSPAMGHHLPSVLIKTWKIEVDFFVWPQTLMMYLLYLLHDLLETHLMDASDPHHGLQI